MIVNGGGGGGGDGCFPLHCTVRYVIFFIFNRKTTTPQPSTHGSPKHPPLYNIPYMFVQNII